MTISQRDLVTSFEGLSLTAHLALPDSAQPRPAVIIFHAWHGRSDFECAQANRLAELGYVAVAADLYGDAHTGADREENARLIEPYVSDRSKLRAALLAVLEAVQALDEVEAGKVAAMGYCFGGLCALDLARSGADVAGVVSFHGLLMPPEGLDSASKSPVLVIHGHKDPMVPVEQVLAFQREMEAAGVDWQLHNHGRAMHAFTLPAANDPDFGTVYDADTDRRSWQALLDFLNEVL